MNTVYIDNIYTSDYTQPQQLYVNPSTVGNMPS